VVRRDPARRAVPPIAPPPAIPRPGRARTLPDRVQLPRLYLAWHTPRAYAPGDAAMDLVASLLASGKNSRLFKRLVYDMQIAQDVFAFQGGFYGKANQLNLYYYATGMPDYFTQDLARYLVLGPSDVQAAVRAFLNPDRRVELSIVPETGGTPAGTDSPGTP
jgi:predicted Zn-dependent peptidase